MRSKQEHGREKQQDGLMLRSEESESRLEVVFVLQIIKVIHTEIIIIIIMLQTPFAIL